VYSRWMIRIKLLVVQDPPGRDFDVATILAMARVLVDGCSSMQCSTASSASTVRAYLEHPAWFCGSRDPFSPIVHSRRRDSVNKASPASPPLTLRSGLSAQLVQCTRCIRTHVNLHLDFGHSCNGTRITWSLHDFILRAKETSRAFVYDDFLVSANGL
jgi:hypothetical protein